MTPVLALLPLLLACSDRGKTLDTADMNVIGDYPSFYGERPKNVLIISIDTYRRDLLQRYGGEPGVTDFMDNMAEHSLVLDNHTTCSNWTKGGVACAANGMYSYEWGLIPRLADQQAGPPRPTLSSMLAVYGYETMLVTSNGWLTDAGLDGGYLYTEQPDNNRAETVAEAGINVLTQHTASSDEPWLLQLHFLEPHAAYNPPSEYLDGIEDLPEIEWNLADREQHYDLLPDWPDMSEEDQENLRQHLWFRYKADVKYFDDELTKIWADLEVRGFLDDTLVVFWTDHGEQFFEHGRQTHVWGLYREENDGVAMMWANNIVPTAWDEPTNHIDIAPTVLSALDLPAPAAWSGQVVGQASPERAIFGESWSREGGPMMSVTMSDKKLIYNWDGDKELYDLVEDPQELENIYDAGDPLVAGMWTELMPVVDTWYDLVGNSAGEATSPGP